MRITAATAAAVLAVTLTQAGALPSSDGGDVGYADVPVEAVPDFYHDTGAKEGAEMERRDDAAVRDPPLQTDLPTARSMWAKWFSENGSGKKPLREQMRRDEAGEAGDGEEEDDDEYPNVGCNCIQDNSDLDAVGLPSIRCGCFNLDDQAAAAGGEAAEPEGQDDGSGRGQDASSNLSKRGKKGFIDINGRWDWWQNQGNDAFPIITGNPNVRVKDWKFENWANLGGIKRRDEGGDKAGFKGRGGGDGGNKGRFGKGDGEMGQFGGTGEGEKGRFEKGDGERFRDGKARGQAHDAGASP